MTNQNPNKKKFKFTWGTGIFVFLILFLIIFGSFIWWSFQQHINIVDPNYYPKGVEYEKQINKFRNNLDLDIDIKITQDAENVCVTFPNELNKIAGEVWFYYPPDSRLDLKDSLILINDTNYYFTKEKLIKGGRYEIIIDWKSDTTNYYFKERITIE